MLLCALTGGIGCGKSTAVKFFRSHNIRVIDADEIARQVVEPGKPAYLKLREEFGPDYFDDAAGGRLLRKELGALIFNNPEKRRQLNAITHPAIRRQIFSQIVWAFLSGCNYVILDIPLFFESNSYGFIKKVIVIHCTIEKQLERLCQRDLELGEEQARARIGAQLPSEYKVARATFSIDNNGSIEETHRQLQLVVDKLNESWHPFVLRALLLSGASLLVLLLLGKLI